LFLFEAKLELSTIILGILSSAFVAINAICTGKALTATGDCIWKLTIYNSFNAVILFIPAILVSGESDEIVAKFFLFYQIRFWSTLILSGIFGFAMSYVTLLQIQYTSPLTHNVSGILKACLQTVLGVFIFKETKTLLWWFSNALVLFGATVYSHVRKQESDKLKKMKAIENESQTDEDPSGDKTVLLQIEDESQQ
jgi:solute carrier family 35 (GDP-fucose transporter), member C1